MLKVIGALASGSLLYLLTNRLSNYWLINKRNLSQKEVNLASNLPFGDLSIEAFRSSFVVVVGIGGVGSHVILALIRSGINHIRVIDYDLVTLSSLNRHAFATLKDVGRLKAKVVRDYAETINPNIVIEIIDDAFKLEDAPQYISKGNPDYVIDCIDDLEAKCDLINYCHSNNIRIISSMGAAGKCNPSLVRYSMFHKINGDVLAKRLRFLYKKKFQCSVPNIPAVLSIEKVSKGLSELEPYQEGDLKQYSINPNERVRTLPVFSCLPAAFGQCLSSVVINILCGNNIMMEQGGEDNKEINKNTVSIGNVSLIKLINDHRIYEMTHRGMKEEQLFLVFDDYYRIAKLFNFFSSISNKIGSKMKFTRWRPHNEPTIDNIVLMNKSELNVHYTIKSDEDLFNSYGKEFVNQLDKKLSSLISNNP